MEIEKLKSITEAMLFAAGREVKQQEIMSILEISADDLEKIVHSLQDEYISQNRGIEIIKLNNSYQLTTKKEYYEYIYPLFDNRTKPTISTAAMETLSIIAYNPKITRAQIEAIRGVNVDGTIYKLLEFGLIEEAGKLELPGKPMGYRTTNQFLKMFGLSSLNELPELPRYKIDENEQIVLDEFINKNENNVGDDESIVSLNLPDNSQMNEKNTVGNEAPVVPNTNNE